ncbi:MAG: PilZ domain-containing protein [Pseudomonadota bacterium]
MSGHNRRVISGRARRSEADAVDLANIEERRAALRRATFKAGEVIFDDGGRLPCIVRNVSENGCLIKLDSAAVLPDLFDLRIDIDKPARTAELVWRSTTLAGAMFIRKPS